MGRSAQKVHIESTGKGWFDDRLCTGYSDARMAGSGALTGGVERGIVGLPRIAWIFFRPVSFVTASAGLTQPGDDGLTAWQPPTHGCEGGILCDSEIIGLMNCDARWALRSSPATVPRPRRISVTVSLWFFLFSQRERTKVSLLITEHRTCGVLHHGRCVGGLRPCGESSPVGLGMNTPPPRWSMAGGRLLSCD